MSELHVPSRLVGPAVLLVENGTTTPDDVGAGDRR